MRSLNKSRRTVGSGELAPLHICFGMLLDLGFCNMKHPVFIFYHSDSSFSPFFYCFYFLLVALHGRLNWGLTVSSLYSRPWRFPLLSCLSPLLYPDCSLEIISPFQFLIIQPLLYLILSGAKTRLLILPSPPKVLTFLHARSYTRCLGCKTWKWVPILYRWKNSKFR